VFGRFLDEYSVGDRWASKGRTITESDLVNFSGFSGDFFPLHVDEEYARETGFGQRIAHGLVGLSVATGLWEMDPASTVAFYGMDRVRFLAPTFIGDTIHIESEVLDVKGKGGGRGVLTVLQHLVKQTGEVTTSAEVKMMLASAPTADPIADDRSTAGRTSANESGGPG
jgi:acyl dehydratase